MTTLDLLWLMKDTLINIDNFPRATNSSPLDNTYLITIKNYGTVFVV